MIADRIRTGISFFLLFLCIILFLPFFIAIVIVPKKTLYKSKLFFFIGNIFYRLVLTCSFLPIKIIGQEHIPQSPVIVVGNHQSSLDIPLMGSLLHGRPHTWLATSDLLKTKLQRWLIKAAINVDVASPMKAMRSLLEAIKTISTNTELSVMIFPEGARFFDGKVHDFFAGFVILARKTNMPVVPVYMHGLHEVYPPRQFLVRRRPVTVIIGKPFVIQETETDEAFKERVHAWFVEQQQSFVG